MLRRAVKVGVDSDGDGITTLTIPEILDIEGWSTVDLLKIDIEGAEKELFEHPSHRDWQGRFRILVVELHDWLKPGCSMAFFRAIVSLKKVEMSLSGENMIIINKRMAGAV